MKNIHVLLLFEYRAAIGSLLAANRMRAEFVYCYGLESGLYWLQSIHRNLLEEADKARLTLRKIAEQARGRIDHG